MQCRCGWLCKESGCTWKVSLLEETSEHSCQKRPRNLTTLTKRSRRFVTSDTLTRLGRNVHARYWQKKEQFFRLVVSFPSQGFHWSGNGKRRWKFLRARKSQEKRDILKKHLADLVPLKAERNIRDHCDLNDLNDLNEEGNFCWTIIHLNERVERTA